MTISNPEVLDNLPEATSDEVREVSLEEVERALREMYDGGFFTRMRSAVEHSPFFVGSKKDSPVVGPEDDAGLVLDMFREHLNDVFIVLKKDGDGTYQRIYDYLEPGSFTRKVALAYYDSEEETEGALTGSNIVGRQSYTKVDFPNHDDITIIKKHVTIPDVV